MHELGHALTARRLGVPAHEILIWPLGGLAFIAHCPSARSDLLIAVAGPATLFWLALLSAATPWYVRGDGTVVLQDWSWGARLCAGAMVMNFALAIFNLGVPAYPLDGGANMRRNSTTAQQQQHNSTTAKQHNRATAQQHNARSRGRRACTAAARSPG